MYTVREDIGEPYSYKYSHRHESQVAKEKAKQLEQGRARLDAFVAANPELGLISREELDGHYGYAVVSWAANERLKQRVLDECPRWEEMAEDERTKGYSLTREYVLREAGVVNLGISRTPAFPSQEADVLRTVAYTRLSHRLEPVLKQRVDAHNQAIEARSRGRER